MAPRNNKLSDEERFSSVSHSMCESTVSADGQQSINIIEELRLLFRLSFPIILMSLFRFANPMISIIICGRLTKTEFDAASLANSIINVFGISIDLGFSTACDTLFSQTFGSKNKKKMGFILQRAMIVMTILYLFLACIHMNIEPILILFQQDFHILRLTSRYVLLFLPGLFFDIQFLALSRYLQNQNIVLPMMVSALCGSIFNGVSQYIAIQVLGFRIDASAVLQAFSCFIMFSTQLIYVLMSKVYVPTWSGFNLIEALSDWKIFFVLGIPGIIMLSVEQWSYEAVTFIAGTINDVQLGGNTIAFQMEFLLISIFSGIGIAVLIRVGQNLGANKPRNAVKVVKVALVSSVSVSVLSALLIVVGRSYISKLFSDDREIQLLGEKLLYIVAAFQLFDSCNCIFGGVLRACGKQFIGAIIMTIAYFAIGIPIGIVLMKFLKIDIIGMWLGLITGYIGETIIFTILILRINWKFESEKVKISTSNGQQYSGKNIKETEVDVRDDIMDDATLFEFDDNETKCLLKSKKQKRLSTSEKTRLLKMRSWQMCGLIVVFLSAVILKCLLPPSLYIPCLIDNFDNSTAAQILRFKNYPLCNDTTVFY